ncbi:putative transporter C1002,16c [Talaromyces islandicus]|uniref:Putative transporter C1002,16c n=1 Tax=Talaromyces islandicus TaxID=28573 RepID=A0A0U1LUV1_TALIS|nr:putative transporter C1002,16c [Talaromyces islandicus]
MEYHAQARDQRAKITIVFVSALSFVLVFARCYARLFLVKMFGLDDALGVFTMPASIQFLYIVIIALWIVRIDLGSGRHIENIQCILSLSQVNNTEAHDFVMHALDTTALFLVAIGQWATDGSWAYDPIQAMETSEIGGALIALFIPALEPLFESKMAPKSVDSEKNQQKLEYDGEIEKEAIEHCENITGFAPEEQKRIIRRVDFRLVVILGCLYFISLLDRTNLGAASVAGMQDELQMDASNNAYSIVTLVFFIPYTIFQIPATATIRKIGPRLFLASIVLAWGATMIGFGFAPNWSVLAGLRVILGCLEAGFYPGCIFLLSAWYCRYELHKRNAGFYLIGSFASGFGGILAYGFMQMDGLAGISGWRWIFVIEGTLTCLFGIVSYFILVDFPEKSPQSWKFLNEREAAFIITRLENDRKDVFAEPFSLSKYLKVGLDLKVWGYCALYVLTCTNTYAIGYFIPIILQDSMNFSVVKAQCLVAPPYVAASIIMYLQAIYSDKWHMRGLVVLGNAALAMIGMALLGYLESPAPRYFGIFLATICSNSNCPALVSWQSNNIRGQWRRAFTSATLIGGGSIGGIIASTVFRAQDAPGYRPGLLAAILANALMIIITIGLEIKFYRANKRAESGGKQIEELEGFRYTY